MRRGPLVDVGADRRAWRRWLRENHRTAREAWLVYWRKSSGKPRIPYDDAVEEALCYGWIDSQQKGLDERRVAQRFSPRRPGSPLSEPNRQRVRKLLRSKRMTKAGLAAIAHVFDPAAKDPPLVLARDVERAIRAEPAAWANFRRLPKGYVRVRIGYIEAGRRHGPAEFRKRLRNFVQKTSHGKRFGFALKSG